MMGWLENVTFWLIAVVAILYIGARFVIWAASLTARWIFGHGSVLG